MNLKNRYGIVGYNKSKWAVGILKFASDLKNITDHKHRLHTRHNISSPSNRFEEFCVWHKIQSIHSLSSVSTEFIGYVFRSMSELNKVLKFEFQNANAAINWTK